MSKRELLRHIPIWPFRRTVQILVVLLLVALPTLARYRHYVIARQYEKFVEKWDGSPHSAALKTTDAVAKIGLGSEDTPEDRRRVRQAVLDRTERFNGSPWSARVFGISMTDLLAGAESMAASRWAPWVLVSGLLLPLLLSILFGRVFCGWICPGGLWSDLAAGMRALLRRGLELPLPTVRITPRAKYVFLVGGLLFALATGVGIMHYVYPPALMAREVHNAVNAQFDLAEEGRLRLAVAGFSSAAVFLVVLFSIEVLFAPHIWCRSLCPGGAIYSALSRLRLLRIRRAEGACTDCAQCDRACPFLLRPMLDGAGSECNACGLCIDSCPHDALHFRVATFLAIGVLLALPLPAEAHHIRGIPHYAYDDNYPQAPVLKLTDLVGSWQFQLTSYPGHPAPGAPTQMHVYVANKESRELYRAPIQIVVRRQGFLVGDEIVYSAEEQPLENLHRFRPRYPDDGNYLVTLSFHDGEVISMLSFPIVVGQPGNPWMTLGGWVGGFLLFVLIIRALRIKLRRRRLRATALEVQP